MSETGEHSPEAAAAGEAAAIAVEEIQSREAVADTAIHAETAAFFAEETAERAEERAEEAAEIAASSSGVAVEVAVEAAEIAEVAHEQAEQAASAGDRALQEVQALREQMEPVLEHYRDSEAQRIAAEQAANQIEEVDVTGGRDDAGDGTGSDSGGSSSGTGNPGSDEPRRPAGRLRRGRR
jgi:membrane protein involved in colicin uptake